MTMNQPETLSWQSGSSDDTPPPPMVDPRDLLNRDQLFLERRTVGWRTV
jgi:hypothetical protein